MPRIKHACTAIFNGGMCCFRLCVFSFLSLILFYTSLSCSKQKDGRRLFVSNKSYREGAVKKSIVFVDPDKSDLEVVLSFDGFPHSKTSKNICDWLRSAHARAGLKSEYILCHATDGASNAVSSAAAFTAVAGAVRETPIQTYVCLAHQVNRSARYASGTGDFRRNINEDLSAVLKKMHEINGRIYRNETRLKILFQVQKDKNRYASVYGFVLAFVVTFFSPLSFSPSVDH
jgi:hypothetical protein